MSTALRRRVTLTGSPKLSTITNELFQEKMDEKVMGYLRCARAVAPAMMRQGWGRIVNISGLNARLAGNAVASMCNVAVAALAKNLADELGPHGINVTVIHPWVTRTEEWAEVVVERARIAGNTAEEVERRLVGPSPSAVWSTPARSPTWWPSWSRRSRWRSMAMPSRLGAGTGGRSTIKPARARSLF